MIRAFFLVSLGLVFAGCLSNSTVSDNGDGDADSDSDSDTDVDTDVDTDTGSGSGSETGNPDDRDGDGFTNDDETSCGSNPDDFADTCYACDWPNGDPGDLVSTGNQVGDTMANVALVDQCGEDVPLWDFAGKYRLFFVVPYW